MFVQAAYFTDPSNTWNTFSTDSAEQSLLLFNTIFLEDPTDSITDFYFVLSTFIVNDNISSYNF